jgi:hypothetical protein
LELDPQNLREIGKREFGKFLIKKGILKKELEVDRLIKAMIDETI